MNTWFRHHSQTRHDKKLRKLLALYGWTAYGIYWALLELMAYDDDHRLEYDFKLLSHTLHLRSKKERDILRAIVEELNLFTIDEEANEFYSEELMDSIEEADEVGYIEDDAVEPKAKAKRAVTEKRLQQLQRAREQKLCKVTELTENVTENVTELTENVTENVTELTENVTENVTELTENVTELTENVTENVTELTENVTELTENVTENVTENHPNKGGDYRGGINPPPIRSIEYNLRERVEKGGVGEKEYKSADTTTTDTEASTSASKSKKFIPPTLEEVQAYCDEKGYKWDAEQFWHYYESNGWLVGRNKMKNWRSAVSNWNKREDATYQHWQATRKIRQSNERNYTSSVNDDAYREAGWL